MNLLAAVAKCSVFTAKSKDGRAAMTQVAYDRGVCIATDGRVMAVAKTPAEDYSTPSVCYVAGTNEELAGFPKWENVLVRDEAIVATVTFEKRFLVSALEFFIKTWKDSLKLKAKDIDKSSPFVVVVDAGRKASTRATLTLQNTGVEVRIPCSTSKVFGVAKGSPITAYNAEYFLKAAKAVEGEAVVLKMQAGGDRASVVSGESDDFCVVLMPVRIR